MVLSIALPDKLPKSLIAFKFISKRPATGLSDDRLESPDHQSIFFTFNIYSMIKIKSAIKPICGHKHACPSQSTAPDWNRRPWTCVFG